MMFNSRTCKLRKTAKLPQAVHGGTLLTHEQVVWLAGGWTCKPNLKVEKNSFWPFKSGRLQAWRSPENFESGVNYVFDPRINIWTLASFTVLGSLSPAALAGPGICRVLSSLFFIGGYNILEASYSTAILALDLTTNLVSKLAIELPEASELTLAVEFTQSSILVLRKVLQPLLIDLDQATITPIGALNIDPSLSIRAVDHECIIFTNERAAYVLNKSRMQVIEVLFAKTEMSRANKSKVDIEMSSDSDIETKIQRQLTALEEVDEEAEE
jgi:hypothetical protein